MGNDHTEDVRRLLEHALESIDNVIQNGLQIGKSAVRRVRDKKVGVVAHAIASSSPADLLNDPPVRLYQSQAV